MGKIRKKKIRVKERGGISINSCILSIKFITNNIFKDQCEYKINIKYNKVAFWGIIKECNLVYYGNNKNAINIKELLVSIEEVGGIEVFMKNEIKAIIHVDEEVENEDFKELELMEEKRVELFLTDKDIKVLENKLKK